MEIFKGHVISNTDLTETGILTVQIPELSRDPLEVTLTSPFYMMNGGGMLGIPDTGSHILVCRDPEDNRLYYLSTIISNPRNAEGGGLLDWKVIGNKYVYTERNKPQVVTYTNQVDSGLKIHRRLLPDYIASKVDLDSENGKRISLNDSPKIDAVLIRNEHGDGIIITSDQNDVHSERSIEVKSKGAHRYTVFQSSMELSVIEGKDITIENRSTGLNAGRDIEGKFGNINIKSENSDININTEAEDGRIFLVTPKSRIQIESDGSILIDTESDIQIRTSSNLDIKADKAIKIEGQSLDIKTDLDCKIDAGGSFSARSSGTNSLDGSQVHFNSGLSQPATPVTPSIPEKTDYGD
jgi:hypothetical protein